MSNELPTPEGHLALCADCGGWDIEWMRQCFTHKHVQFCRGCECPYCAEDADGEDYDEDWRDDRDE